MFGTEGRDVGISEGKKKVKNYLNYFSKKH